MNNLILIFLSVILSAFFSCIFLEKINKKILNFFMIALLVIFFSFLSFKIFNLLLCYNNLYLTITFILLGIIFGEFSNLLFKNKKSENIKSNFLNKEYIYFFSQGVLLKFVIDIQYKVGIVFLIIIFFYNIFRNLKKLENRKNIIFINSLFIFLGSLLTNIFTSVIFIFVSFLWGFILYMLSDEITVYLSKIKYKVKI